MRDFTYRITLRHSTAPHPPTLPPYQFGHLAVASYTTSLPVDFDSAPQKIPSYGRKKATSSRLAPPVQVD